LLAAMPVHDEHLARRERAHRVQHMGKKRPAGQRVQDLGKRGMHALSFARGQNDDFQGHTYHFDFSLVFIAP
jgi:hypothetical protein